MSLRGGAHNHNIGLSKIKYFFSTHNCFLNQDTGTPSVTTYTSDQDEQKDISVACLLLPFYCEWWNISPEDAGHQTNQEWGVFVLGCWDRARQKVTLSTYLITFQQILLYNVASKGRSPKSKVQSPEDKDWDWGWDYNRTGHSPTHHYP